MILMGVFDVELREYLVERGHRDGLKFAFPNRGEKEDSLCDRIIVKLKMLLSRK